MSSDYRDRLTTAKANLKTEQKKKYKIYNFCKNFHLEDEIKEKSFNNKYSDPKLIHVFSKNNDYTPSLHNSIKTRITNGTNILLDIYGEQHSGKSHVGQTLAFEIIEEFELIQGNKVDLKLGFSTSEFNRYLTMLKKGDVLIRDENPKEHGKGSRNMEENLENVVDIIRKHLNSFIFIAPRKLSNTLITYYLETAGKNFETKQVRCLLYDPSFKEGKEPIGRVFITLHDDYEFSAQYDKRKDGIIKDGLAHGGHFSAEIDLERFKNDIKRLFKWAIREKVDHKNLLEAEIKLFNSQFDPDKERDKMVKWDSGTMPMVINKVWSKLTKRKKRIENRRKRLKELKRIHERRMEEKQREQAKLEIEQQINADLTKFNFKYNENKIYNLVREEKGDIWRNVERDIEIYILSTKERMFNSKIAKRYKTIKDRKGISNVVKKVQGEINRIKGKLLEAAFSKYLKMLNIFDSVEDNGSHGEFDVVAYKDNATFVFSLKNIKVDKQHYNEISGEEFYPEVKFAREQKERHNKDVYAYLCIFDNLKEEFLIKGIDLSFPIKSIKISS
ncbi:hypothetical protein LCGC14_1051600 [marine sediment metagenome]|uniref:Uncharacterized protein n=1 Tax=marine sediment metagenome TaxID=412755 RepID=A0A0F9MT38_9ZZZZ